MRLIGVFLFFILGTTLFVSCGGDDGASVSSGGTATALALPSNLEIISSTATATGSAPLASDKNLKDLAQYAKAYNDTGTDYSSQNPSFHIWHPALESLGTPDEILCFLGKLKYDTMLNQGTYVAMVDDSDCGSSEESPSQSSQSGSSGASSATSLQKVYVNSSRTNSSAPHIVQIWFEESDGPGGQPMTIKAYASITEAPSATKKFGTFTLTFGMYNTSGTKMGGGVLATAAGTTDRPVAFTFVESMTEQSYTRNVRSSVEMAVNASGAVTEGRAAIEVSGSQTTEGYVLSYLNDYILIDTATSLSAVDLLSPVCMGIGENDIDEIVHGYNLYDYTTGALKTINSGFPITYTDATGDLRYGHLGYYGMWTEESPSSLTNGSTITKLDWQNPANSQTYTLFQSPGLLVKSTVKQLNVDDLDGIEFSYWDWLDDVTNGSHVVKYLEAGDASATGGAGFYKVGTLIWSQNGPPTKTIGATATKINTSANPASPYKQLSFHSEQLRGGVRFVHGDSFITYFVRENVMPDDADFTAGSLALYCLRDCLKSNMATSDMSAWGGIYETNPTTTSDTVAYTIATSDMTLKKSGVAVGPGAGVSYSGSYGYGIRSGAMVTAATLATLTNIWDVYSTVGNVFYEWEQSDNSWSKLTLAKDANNNFVNFDAPLKISYQHSTANDRNADPTYNGQTFLLEYGGPGMLWGFPTDQKDTDGDGTKDRWFPLANLNDGVSLLSNTYAVKAVGGNAVMAAVSSSNCSGLSLALPGTSVPDANATIANPGNHAVATPTDADTGDRICAPNAVTGEIDCAGI